MDALSTNQPEEQRSDPWRQLADQISQLVWISDRAGKPCWFNRAMLDFAGYEVADLQRQGWQALVHPDDLPELLAGWEAAASSGSRFACDYRLRHRSGDYRAFSARVEPVRGAADTGEQWITTLEELGDAPAAERHSGFLLELEAIVRSATGPEECKRKAAGLLATTLSASRVLYADVDADARTATVKDEVLAAGVPSIAGTHGIAPAIFARYVSGAPLISEDFAADPLLADAHRPEILALPFAAVLDIPLLRAGRVVAVLAVHDVNPRRWSEDEIALARATAERTWEAVERARAEQQLRMSEAQFRSTADAVPGLLFVTDPAGRSTYVNQFYKDYSGREEEDGYWWREVIHPEDLERFIEETKRARLAGDDFRLDYRICRADGQYRWHSTKATPTRDEQGDIVRWVGVSLDVHDRHLAEQQALETAEEIEAIYSTAPVGLTVLDRELRYVRINERLAEMNGLPAAAHLGKSLREIVPALAEEAEAALGRVLEGEEIWGLELTGETPAEPGKLRTWRENCLPVRSAGGEVVGVAISAEDVTIAKEAELARRKAEDRFATIFNSAAIGIARVSPDGEFLEINDRYCAILGRSRKEVLNASWRQFTLPEDADKDHALVEAARNGDIDSFTSEKRYLDPAGREVWVDLTISVERYPDGRIRGFIAVAQDIGERRLAEAALRASEERYRALFGSMEQGFCIVQVSFDEKQQPVDYRFTEINPAFTRQSGLPASVLNKSVRDVLPDLHEDWFLEYGEIAATGIHKRFIRYAAPLGKSFEVYAFPIGLLEDRNVALLFTDVTERIGQEEALRRSEQEMRFRLNAIPQMVWSTLPDGYHDFYNDRWYEFTGTPIGSTDGEGWNGMFHPDDQARAFERWHQSLRTGEPYEIEYRLRHHTGTYRWVLGRALPIRSEAGEIVRWMGTCTDIDDRIEAARALRESEERLTAVIAAAPVGLVFANADGQITGGNKRVEQIVGHPVLPSPNVDSYQEWVSFHPDGRQVEGHEYPLAKVLNEGLSVAEMEVHYQRGDGSRSWVRFSAAPIRDSNGDLAGGVVASVDIDHEKRLTETLEREVEKVVAEREAAQEALRQSQKLEAMGQLTGGVAHDFNNLLTPIIGSLDLLQRKQILDARTGRLVEGALASAEKARVLVQRLLAFARRQPLQAKAVDLGRIVTEMSDLIDSTSGPRVRVEVALAPVMSPAMADSNQLEMALLNLAVNARDAMPEGGTLTIGARPEPSGAGARLGLKGEPHLVLSVSDTGVGMDEETLRRAIEPFFSTKGIGKGTGLGLSMVHGLAAQLGGALDIRSAQGVGTTVELWLPVAGQGVAPEASDGPESSSKGIGTALLVDDEELVRASTASMLADLGFNVVEAESGEEALSLIKNGLIPDLLVTDQLMPGLSGTDLAVRLRGERPELPVLIVSGYADLDSLSPGFPHLSKPFRQAELSAAMEKLTAPAD